MSWDQVIFELILILTSFVVSTMAQENCCQHWLLVFSNGDDQLEKAMEEILRDSEKDQNNSTAFSEGSSDACSQASGLGSAGQTNQPSLQLVLDPSTTEVSTRRSSSPHEPLEEDSVLFNKLTYLGCMKVSAPRNEPEALRAMANMKSSSQAPLSVTLYVPNVPEGSVRIIDQSSNVEIASFPIYKVLFCVRGQNGTSESDCFAFTESSCGTEEFQIHVFSCEIKEAGLGGLWGSFQANRAVISCLHPCFCIKD
uniref:PID domain-containing protein n=1 Tax=Meleagris gallopavo TaxID=9103 RepID=A0A803Y3Q2_MELGA